MIGMKSELMYDSIGTSPTEAESSSRSSVLTTTRMNAP